MGRGPGKYSTEAFDRGSGRETTGRFDFICEKASQLFQDLDITVRQLFYDAVVLVCCLPRRMSQLTLMGIIFAVKKI